MYQWRLLWRRNLDLPVLGFGVTLAETKSLVGRGAQVSCDLMLVQVRRGRYTPDRQHSSGCKHVCVDLVARLWVELQRKAIEINPCIGTGWLRRVVLFAQRVQLQVRMEDPAPLNAHAVRPLQLVIAGALSGSASVVGGYAFDTGL